MSRPARQTSLIVNDVGGASRRRHLLGLLQCLRSRNGDAIGYQEGRIEDATFVVLAADQQPALQRMLELSREDFGYDLSDRNLQTLDAFLKLFAFDTVRDGNDIVGLEFEDRLMLEIDDVFRELGPWVQSGSQILMHSGTGARWRYMFEDGRTTTREEATKPWYGS